MAQKTGLVIGKFYPLHKGHQYLIETALKNCDKLYIILCYKKEEKPGCKERYEWITGQYPEAKVIVLEDVFDPDDTQVWVNVTKEILSKNSINLDIVFSSENYGFKYSEGLGCEHYLVDIERDKFHISGTKIRENPMNHLDYLDIVVKQWYLDQKN